MGRFYEAEQEGIDSEFLEQAFQLLNKKRQKPQPELANEPGSSILDGLDDQRKFVHKHERERTNSRARREARVREIELEENLDPAGRQDFQRWQPERRWDRSNFDYLFYHRKRLAKIYGSALVQHLEIVSAKINFVSGEGRDGYFKKLERNIGWLDHILPIIFCGSHHADRLVRCGLWINAKNSRRCHKPDYCPLCHWNDILKVLVQSFSVKSGAFGRSPCWSFITCGFTTNPANAKAVGRPLADDDFDHVRGDDHYDAFPTMLGNDDENPDDFSDGYQDARILAIIVQESLDQLYQCDIVDGYRNKIEGAYRIKPNPRPQRLDSPQAGPVYVNMHGHAIANGRETNLQFIADALMELMRAGLQKYRKALSANYYPDVLALGMPSAEALVACIVYAEKVVAVDAIVKDAMLKPGAFLENGQPSPQYVKALDESLNELLDEHIPNLFGQLRLDDETRWLRRRKAIGNMQFKDGDTFIGKEPKWHVELRHKKAKALKDKRQRQKNKANSKKPSKKLKKKQKRTITNPRRLARTLRQQPRLDTAGGESS
jgi:hypothetical protein